jgi:hypothetical protein
METIVTSINPHTFFTVNITKPLPCDFRLSVSLSGENKSTKMILKNQMETYSVKLNDWGEFAFTMEAPSDPVCPADGIEVVLEKGV